MPRQKTEVEVAAGKLISAIQKEWGEELGYSVANVSEEVMSLAHELLQARTPDAVFPVLGSRTLAEFLGELWVARHPRVMPAISELEQAIAAARV